MNRLFHFIAIVVTVWTVQSAAAQESPAFYDYVHSDLDWYTMETRHFLIHFHSDSTGTGSRTARVVARVAEDIYGPITELYQHEPDTKVSFILKDYEDYSNGATYFFDNVIQIWAPALETPFRGEHNWLRNVITHEFTHMVQVQVTMKANRRMPFLYLQYLDYEDVRRPDVLYGFPNVIATYPIPILNNPAWLAEGTAQFQREWLHYDRWDSHRDMLLRTQVLGGRELSLDEMGGFYSHTSLMRESVYNHGFAFTSWLADRFGESALRTLSESLGQWDNWTFEQAAKDAFGIDGQTLYDEWMDGLRSWYEQRAGALYRKEFDGRIIEDEGFLNLEPAFSPDGTRIAWVSNKGEDFSLTSLHISDLEGNELAVLDVPIRRLEYICSMGHRLVGSAAAGITWSPDGSHIVYTTAKDSPEGHLVSDLWRVEVATQETEQLSRGQRASDPAYSPDGTQIAFVSDRDGTTNLAVYSVASDSVRFLTRHDDGSQIRHPVYSPEGNWIYFDYATGHGRDIYRIPAIGGSIEPFIATEFDERSPAVDLERGLVFSSDRSGIFNLYLLDGLGTPQALTDEVGGAFQPTVSTSGSIAFARFTANGYTLAMIDPDTVVSPSPQPYSPPDYLIPETADQTTYQAAMNKAEDSNVRGFAALKEDLRYHDTYTSMSFLPVIRLDRYVSRRRSTMDVRLPDRSRAETLWRNTKLGVYAATREILGGLSFFGGALIAPGSNPGGGGFLSPTNLLDLERDIFLQVDYAGGFAGIHQRWAPQFSIQLFNVRRNVPNGLSVEEFPCTACYPDTTLVDLSYNLWEADLLARSKVSRSVLLEAGYRYSPYRVNTERFLSSELDQTVPENSSRYFIGRAFHVRAIAELFHPDRDGDVVPKGIRIEAVLEREKGRLLDSFSLDDGLLSPEYEGETVNRATLSARAGLRLGDWPTGGEHGLEFRFRASTILGSTVDDFYNDYVGGLTGARGYPFYALGGNETLWAQASWSFPLFPRISRQFLFTYVDKVYLRTFADAAMAFSGEFPGLGQARKDIGSEIRIGLGSYYLLPTAFFVSATYGLDAFDFRLDEGFLTPNGQDFVRYGQEWQWHVGVLFSFDQL